MLSPYCVVMSAGRDRPAPLLLDPEITDDMVHPVPGTVLKIPVRQTIVPLLRTTGETVRRGHPR